MQIDLKAFVAYWRGWTPADNGWYILAHAAEALTGFRICSGASGGRWWIKTPEGDVLEDAAWRRRYFKDHESAARALMRIIESAEYVEKV